MGMHTCVHFQHHIEPKEQRGQFAVKQMCTPSTRIPEVSTGPRVALTAVTNTDRQRGREAEKQRGRRADRQAGRQAGRQADRQADRQAGRQAGRQADRQAGRQTGRQADRQADRLHGCARESPTSRPPLDPL
eukprot:6027849-Pyramimonas_sp.AAC.1